MGEAVALSGRQHENRAAVIAHCRGDSMGIGRR